MNLDLSGKNALVCGASRGIGRGAAEELARLGANVTIIARSASVLSEVVRALPHSGNQHHDFLVADFKDRTDLKKKVTGLAATKTIHILVNNTGGPAGGPITLAEPEDFLKAIELHLVANHILSKILSKGMKNAGYGRIINVISTSVKQPIPGLGVSNTTRGAVANWAKTLATELGPFGITVNNVLPGSTNTERITEILDSRAEKSGTSFEIEKKKMMSTIPAGRFAEPNEIGSAIAFLASPAASYINGINLPVDGGRTKSL